MSFATAVIGYTTSTSARVLGIFNEPVRARARLAYRDGVADPKFIDVDVVPAPPFGIATFQLRDLSGVNISYGIADYAADADPPDPFLVLANSSAKFRTLPERPLRIGLISCNDIEANALPKAQRGALWRDLKQRIDAGEVDLLVHAGDQIYADDPPPDWLPEEGRTAAYRRHYVRTWSHPDVAAVLSSCPSLMMWDDHEIYDGYGSHDNDSSQAAQARYQAAEIAFREFQVSLNPPDKLSDTGFGWLFRYRDMAIVAVDGRSQRSFRLRTILGSEQLDDLEVTLGTLVDAGLKQLFVIVGTPVVYVPLMAAEKLAALVSPEGVDDIRDGWSASNNQNECRRFLMTLLNFAGHSPKTQVTLLGGDIHVGTLSRIRTTLSFGRERIHPELFQVTSSGIARPPPRGVAAFMLSLITNGGTQLLFNEEITGSLQRFRGSPHDFCLSRRNYAIIETADSTGLELPSGALRIKFSAEFADGIRVLEQQLVRA